MSYDNKHAQEAIGSICQALARYDESVTDNRSVENVARDWRDAGFEDAEEVEDWLRARCFKASAAHALDAAGITPEQAALSTTKGTTPYQDTIAYKFAQGDLSCEEARRIITNHFWNS